MPGRVGGSPVTVIKVEGEARGEHVPKACDRLVGKQRVGTLAETAKISRVHGAIGPNATNAETDMRSDRPTQTEVINAIGHE
jgi:hypothetical protein